MITEFKKYLEGCGNLFEMKNKRGGYTFGGCGDIGLCPTCKANIQGQIKIMKEMKEFLNLDFDIKVLGNKIYSKDLREFEIFSKEIQKLNTCLELAKERGFEI